MTLGAMSYKFSAKTPEWAYQSMINLFCITGGWSNSFLSFVIGIFNGKYEAQVFAQKGVLGGITYQEANLIADTIKRDGFIVFENALPDSVCKSLMDFALKTPCLPRKMDGEISQENSESFALYSITNPVAVRYDYSSAQILKNKDVQKLLADPTLLMVAQSYLGSKPIVDILSMWWHTAFSNHPDSQAAQYFHFDMDRPKWLKFFFYLTDVDSKNGPHVFIKGTHRNNGIPTKFLRKGYARIADDELEDDFPKDLWKKFTGSKGALIIEDTRGLHKGQHVELGERLILQLQFSNSLFGAESKCDTLERPLAPELELAIKKFPKTYSNFLISK